MHVGENMCDFPTNINKPKDTRNTENLKIPSCRLAKAKKSSLENRISLYSKNITKKMLKR